MTFNTTAIATLLALSLGSVSGAALAEPAEMTLNHAGQRTMKVHYGDLNLEHRDGIAELQQRLVDGSHRVCGQTRSTSSRNLARNRERKACFRRTIAKALDDKAFAFINQKTKERIALNSYTR